MFNKFKSLIKYIKSNEEEKEKIREDRYEKQLEKEQIKAKEREEKHKIKEVKKSNRYFSSRLEKFTTSKLLMYLIFINCSIIEIYSMWVMYHFEDLSALYSLIGAVCGESLSYAIYSAKAFSETKEEAKNQLERDKFFYNTDDAEEVDTYDIINEEIDDTNE